MLRLGLFRQINHLIVYQPSLRYYFEKDLESIITKVKRDHMNTDDQHLFKSKMRRLFANVGGVMKPHNNVDNITNDSHVSVRDKSLLDTDANYASLPGQKLNLPGCAVVPVNHATDDVRTDQADTVYLSAPSLNIPPIPPIVDVHRIKPVRDNNDNQEVMQDHTLAMLPSSSSRSLSYDSKSHHNSGKGKKVLSRRVTDFIYQTATTKINDVTTVDPTRSQSLVFPRSSGSQILDEDGNIKVASSSTKRDMKPIILPNIKRSMNRMTRYVLQATKALGVSYCYCDNIYVYICSVHLPGMYSKVFIHLSIQLRGALSIDEGPTPVPPALDTLYENLWSFLQFKVIPTTAPRSKYEVCYIIYIYTALILSYIDAYFIATEGLCECSQLERCYYKHSC